MEQRCDTGGAGAVVLPPPGQIGAAKVVSRIKNEPTDPLGFSAVNGAGKRSYGKFGLFPHIF